MPRFRPVFLAFVLGLGACAAQPAGSGNQEQAEAQPPTQPPISHDLNSLQGLRVSSIQINGTSVQHPEWLEPMLAQKVNQPLDKYKVRESVQALYDTGKFSEIEVEAQKNAQGEVVLTFSAHENFFFGSIRVEGAPAPPTENQLANASKLTLGEQFRDEKIKSAIEGMQRVLQESGYYQATIQPSYDWDSQNQQVKVLFTVEKGRRAHIGNINITGAPGVPQYEVLEDADLEPGDRVSAANLTRALQRLRKRFQKNQRLEAQVTLTSRTYHPETNTVDYTFDIVRGPVVDVRVDGAKLRGNVIKKLVPIYEENAVDQDLLNEGARNIRDYLQTKGYFDAAVTFDEHDEPNGRRNIVFHIDRRERHKFVELVIQGNKYFRREDLRERMQMQPAGGLLLYGLFSQSILARDIQAIKNLYSNNGFLEITITPDVQDDYEGKKGRLKVSLTVDEGPQTTIGKLAIEGNTGISTDELRGIISATEGQPYSDSTVITDQTSVMDAYFNRGFPGVKVDYTTTPEQDPTKVDVTYNVTEGAQVFVDRVLISGLHFTRAGVVEREMKISSGEPLSQQQMLQSQSRLYDMGIFNEVNMAIQNPEGDSTHKNINFQLAEAKRYTFNYGAGIEVQTGQPGSTSNPQGTTGASPHVSFDITRLNFRGRDHTISLKTRYGNLEKLALVGYDAPRLFNSPNFTFDLTTFYEQTNDVKTFTAKRVEGSAEVRETLNKATSLVYRFIYRRVSTDNLVIDPSLVPLFSQPVRVGLPDFSYIRNTRDNDIESHKGSFSSMDLGVASNAFGSEPNFARLVLQNSTYYQFHKRRWVFARSTRIGIEEPFAGTSAAIAPSGAPLSISFIPLPERFLAGGSTSHRGFGINQAGPRDLTSGFQLGGEALFINNLELRTPPLPFPFVGNNLSAVVFHDMGNVFTTPREMAHNLFRYVQKDRSTCLNPAAQACDFNYVSHAVGAGIRYRTPVGPVSFDMGYNLNPPAFPITQPPNGTKPTSQVLRHFNFFFNIGQTF
ncbi:MAG TPA: POTRA domain-containing protein [Terriglobales bacterium]|nr:POTRA domain-containing protein [Terriglobales bacterium]